MYNVPFLILLVSLSFQSFGQKAFRPRPYWSSAYLISSSTFLSDLGGKNDNGTNDILDTDLKKTRYAVGTGIRLHLNKGFNFGLETFYTRLAADDAETESSRTIRNLSVRTDVLETSFKLEYVLPSYTGKWQGLYLNAGCGAVLYKPMAELNGQWHSLRPLGTEGQNIDPTKSPYNPFSVIIPFGFGKNIKLNNGMTLGIDISLRKSFTDYLDDVSTSYFDNNLIRAHSGDIAAQLADRSSGSSIGQPGSIRGNPKNNDNYFLVGLKLINPMKPKRYKRARYLNTDCTQRNSRFPTFNNRGKIRNY